MNYSLEEESSVAIMVLPTQRLEKIIHYNMQENMISIIREIQLKSRV